MAKLPRNYIVKGGGNWLDIDYSNIDFDHAGVSPNPDGPIPGHFVNANEKTPFYADAGNSLVIGMGFKTEEIAEAELRRLRETVESDLP